MNGLNHYLTPECEHESDACCYHCEPTLFPELWPGAHEGLSPTTSYLIPPRPTTWSICGDKHYAKGLCRHHYYSRANKEPLKTRYGLVEFEADTDDDMQKIEEARRQLREQGALVDQDS